METYKIMVPYSDYGEIGICEAIDYKGGVWLVPYWIDNIATGVSKPVRIVRVDLLGLQPMKDFAGCRYSVPAMTVSKALLEGRAQPIPPIETVESPDVEVLISGPSPAH